jgi:uncharacterized protein YbaR (Trm112 family)
MHIELIDLLRCPEPHEETWLVAAFNKIDGRDVIEAKLGCPVCRREYFIRDGIADFGGTIGADSGDEDPVRTAALLDLTSPGKTVLLAGAFGRVSSKVVEMTQSTAVSLNAAAANRDDRILEVLTDSRIPLASDSLDGVALDRAHSTESFIAEALRLLRPGGRALTSVAGNPTSVFQEIARDDHHILSEKKPSFTTLLRKAGR